MARDHPDMQQKTAKVLKHSKQTERIYYDFGQAPKQAVTIRALMEGKKHVQSRTVHLLQSGVGRC